MKWRAKRDSAWLYSEERQERNLKRKKKNILIDSRDPKYPRTISEYLFNEQVTGVLCKPVKTKMVVWIKDVEIAGFHMSFFLFVLFQTWRHLSSIACETISRWWNFGTLLSSSLCNYFQHDILLARIGSDPFPLDIH